VLSCLVRKPKENNSLFSYAPFPLEQAYRQRETPVEDKSLTLLPPSSVIQRHPQTCSEYLPPSKESLIFTRRVSPDCIPPSHHPPIPLFLVMFCPWRAYLTGRREPPLLPPSLELIFPLLLCGIRTRFQVLGWGGFFQTQVYRLSFASPPVPQP